MIVLPGPADTHALGVRLGRFGFPGAVLALAGELGAGKTALVRGLAEGLGIAGRIGSPTFGLLHEYAGRIALYHADWYRLSAAAEVEDSDLFALAVDGVLAIEWADRFPALLPPDRLQIALADHGSGRVAVLTPFGASHGAWAAAASGS